jgi:hypothetical protein
MTDFNGDGKIDLATANGDAGTVSVLLGTGAGAFKPPVNAAAGSYPRGVAVGDFNRDGRPDLAASAPGMVTAPTLFIVGGNDPSVLDLNEGALTLLKGPKALEIVAIRGSGTSGYNK